MKINAKYIESEFPFYRGNPLIEALTEHVIEDEDALHSQLMTTFNLPDDLWSMDEMSAKDYIALLDDIYIPHVNTWQLYVNIIQQIKVGYRKKNPLSSDGQKLLNLISIMNRDGQSEALENRIAALAGKARCSLSVGVSGVGKTESTRSVLERIPQVISHRMYNGQRLELDQLVWVSFDVTSTNSIKGLAANFFEAVDRAIGTHYAIQFSNFKEPVDVFIGNMRTICIKHAIGFVHIDECQHLLRRMKSQYSASVADLESMFNRLGIPMLMTCTPEGVNLFFQSNIDNDLKPRVEIIRRLISERVYPFEPLGVDTRSFQRLFDACLPENLFSGTDVLSDAFRHKVHEMSFGIHDVAVRLMRLFFEAAYQQQHMIQNNNSISLLDKVYTQHFEHMRIAIIKLREQKTQTWERLHETSYAPKKSTSSKTQSRTMHSSRLAPRMASDKAKDRLKQEAGIAIFKDSSDVALTTGLADCHQ
tara:strand:- start:3228 stop:4655 length:1428 start_codon:yes stop_codon:yes gene_type:complete